MKKKKDVLLMILATVVAMLAMSVNVWQQYHQSLHITLLP